MIRISKFSNKILFMILFMIFSLKFIFFLLVKNDILILNFGGGSDAEYYHNYTLYAFDGEKAVNIWPLILKYFHSIDLYSREVVSYFLLFLNLLVIPVLVSKLSGLEFKYNQKLYLFSFLICLIYPTLFFYTFDIYRDVFMVFSFLISCLIIKLCLSSNSFLGFNFLYILAIAMGFFLLALRPYLGYAFLLSLLLWKLKFTKKRIIFLGFFYFLLLFLANYLGFFERLTDYRSAFEEGNNNSTLGLDFSNPVMFIPNFILSLLGQLFGFYITNPIAIILLIVETLPFFFMLGYVLKNISFADSFIRFLIIFFVLYSSVWLIGNDNLGTAVRLRLYNYIVIYICFFYIVRLKDIAKYQQVIGK